MTPKAKRKLFEDKAKRTQAFDVGEEVVKAAAGNVTLLLKATRLAAKRRGQDEVVEQVDKILKANAVPKKVEPLSVLAFHLDNKFSSAQYIETRRFFSEQGVSLLPSYYRLSKLKEECHPTGITVDETTASVPIQDLHDHTSARLIQHVAEDVKGRMVTLGLQGIRPTLIYSWGFDGSTGQSQYNRRMAGTDSSLFATTAIPLKLVDPQLGVLWENPAPASTRFVRPVCLQFAKETKDLVLATRVRIQDQIDRLEPEAFFLTDELLANLQAQFHLTHSTFEIFLA